MRHVSYICDINHAYVPWLIHMRHVSYICDMSRAYMTWLIHIHSRRRSDFKYLDLQIYQLSWYSRSISFSDRSFECRALHLLTWKLVWNCGDSRENVFDMYGDSRENLLEILAVVIIRRIISIIISSPISSVCGWRVLFMCDMSHIHVTYITGIPFKIIHHGNPPHIYLT